MREKNNFQSYAPHLSPLNKLHNTKSKSSNYFVLLFNLDSFIAFFELPFFILRSLRKVLFLDFCDCFSSSFVAFSLFSSPTYDLLFLFPLSFIRLLFWKTCVLFLRYWFCLGETSHFFTSFSSISVRKLFFFHFS